MKKSSIVILSGACCNPSLKNMDAQIEKVMKEAAVKMEVGVTIKTVSIASTAMGGFGGFGETVRAEITALLKSKGIGILPLVIINGRIAYYATVPTLDQACDSLR